MGLLLQLVVTGLALQPTAVAAAPVGMARPADPLSALPAGPVLGPPQLATPNLPFAHLAFRWPVRESFVGVPLNLDLVALNAAGAVDSSINDQATLLIPDQRATLDGKSGAPTLQGQRFIVNVSHGHSTHTIVFHTPGQSQLQAALWRQPTVAGMSTDLTVQGVFLTLGLPATVHVGAAVPLTLTAHDAQGAPVSGFVDTVDLTPSDPTAVFQDGAGARRAATAPHVFTAADQGRAALSVTFTHPGKQTLTVRDRANPSLVGQTTVTVGKATAAAVASPRFGPLASSSDFTLSFSPTAANAGVPVTLTVTAPSTSYTGTVSLSFSDPLAQLNPLLGGCVGNNTYFANCYTFTSADNGTHAFTVTFNTAGAQTATATDVNVTGSSGTSPAFAVAETDLVVQPQAGTTPVNQSLNITLSAVDAATQLPVTGYRGTIAWTSSWGDASNWQGTSDFGNDYTFMASDNGVHTFPPTFKVAGNETVTATDTANTSRTGTAAVTVTAVPDVGAYEHSAANSAAALPDGSTVWAFTGGTGRLWVRRNLGAALAPVWQSGPVLARDTASGVGADSPSIVALGSTLALFHTYTDGSYYQAWVTVSSDNGQTWSTPLQLTSAAVDVAWVRAVVVGGTVTVFWSRNDTNQQLWSMTSTDFAHWSTPALTGAQVGVPVGNTNPTFSIIHLANNQWLLGYLAPSDNCSELGGSACHTTDYPTVHLTTSSDLASWSTPVEANMLPYADHWPSRFALAQSPSGGALNLLFEREYGVDNYLSLETSADAVTWSSEALAVEEQQIGTSSLGSTGYWAENPTLLPDPTSGGVTAITANRLCGGGVSPCYGQYGELPNSVEGLAVNAPASNSEPIQISLLVPSNSVTCPTGFCAVRSGVNTFDGSTSYGATDLVVRAVGMPIALGRSYRSQDAATGYESGLGVGWHWTYDAHLQVLGDGSLNWVTGNGQQTLFFKAGSGWTAAAGTNASVTTRSGGGWLVTTPALLQWAFDGTGKLLSVTDRNGNMQTLTYTGSQVTAVVASSGQTLTLTYNAAGLISTASTSAGQTVSYGYDSNNNLTSVTDALGKTTTYAYDSLHDLLAATDANAHASVTYSVGGGREALAAADALGNSQSYAYAQYVDIGGATAPTVVTDALGNTTSYQNDGGNRLTQTVSAAPSGNPHLTTSYAYDSNNDVTSVVDPNGVTTSMTYDAAGNLLSKTVDPTGLNLTTTYTYDSQHDLLTTTDALGHVTTNTYDSHGNRLTTKDALGNVTTFTYTSAGQLATTTDPLGNVTTNTYDSSGNLTSVKDALGNVTTMTYDSQGRLLTRSDPLNHTTSYTYDADGRLLTTTDALGKVTTNVYDSAGNLTSVTDPLNHTTTYSYDQDNRQTAVTDPLGKVTTTAYDALSRVSSVTDPNGNATTMAYDAFGRQTSTTDALSHTSSATYDGNGNALTSTDALGHTTTSAYDHANRLLTSTDALSHTWTMTYDAVGNELSLTDPNSHSQTFTYDQDNRRLTSTDALSHTTTVTYNAAGETAQVQLPSGAVNRFVYDADHRLSGIDLGNTGTLSISFVFDAAGRRTSMTDATGTTSYTYDSDNRLLSQTAPVMGTASFAYDAAGERTTVTYPSSQQVSYAYTARGQLASVTDGTNVTTYAYDNAGRQTGATLGNGVTSTLSYDNANRLTAISDASGSTSLFSVSYGLDAVGNRTSETDNGTSVTSYTYDALNRLLSASYPNGDAASYVYDPVGNRTSETFNSTVTTSTYNAADELTAAGTTSYTYDANGNELTAATGSTTTTYSYDLLNRLTGITGPTTATYTYNGDGERVSKKVGTNTTRYVWDPSGVGHVLADSNGYQYVWGAGLVSQITNLGTRRYPLADGLGSVRVLTDHNGAAIGSQTYDAYGSVRTTSGLSTLPFGFSGEQTDSESGLIYLRARYMDPTTGRFLSKDPAKSGWAYGYANDNPVLLTDAAGQAAVACDSDCGSSPTWSDTCDWSCKEAESGAPPPAPSTTTNPPNCLVYIPNSPQCLLPGPVFCWLTGCVTTVGIPNEQPKDGTTGETTSSKALCSWDEGSGEDNLASSSNPVRGRFDHYHASYDQALAAARMYAGDLGSDTEKLYDEATGTLLGERSADDLRGWRIDYGHVNWWDWTQGKKGKGGQEGHEYYPEEQVGPYSKSAKSSVWVHE